MFYVRSFISVLELSLHKESKLGLQWTKVEFTNLVTGGVYLVEVCGSGEGGASASDCNTVRCELHEAQSSYWNNRVITV